MTTSNPPTAPEGVELAQAFHETYERLAPSFGYVTRLETRTFDPQSKNGQLMVAVCQALQLHGGGESRSDFTSGSGVWIPQAALDWLNGEGDSFEKPEGARGNFWWRTEFRRRCAAATPDDECLGGSELKPEARPILQGPTREEVLSALKAKVAAVKSSRMEMGFSERSAWRPLYDEEIADSILALLNPTSPWRPTSEKPEDGERCLVLLNPDRFGVPQQIDTWDGWLETFTENGDQVVGWQRFPALPGGEKS